MPDDPVVENTKPYMRIMNYVIKLQSLYETVKKQGNEHVDDFIDLRKRLSDRVASLDLQSMLSVTHENFLQDDGLDNKKLDAVLNTIEQALMKKINNDCKGFMRMHMLGKKSIDDYAGHLSNKEGHHYTRLLLLGLKHIYDKLEKENIQHVKPPMINDLINLLDKNIEEKYYHRQLAELDRLITFDTQKPTAGYRSRS